MRGWCWSVEVKRELEVKDIVIEKLGNKRFEESLAILHSIPSLAKTMVFFARFVPMTPDACFLRPIVLWNASKEN